MSLIMYVSTFAYFAFLAFLSAQGQIPTKYHEQMRPIYRISSNRTTCGSIFQPPLGGVVLLEGVVQMEGVILFSNTQQ
jgi:hypothetical protein